LGISFVSGDTDGGGTGGVDKIITHATRKAHDWRGNNKTKIYKDSHEHQLPKKLFYPIGLISDNGSDGDNNNAKHKSKVRDRKSNGKSRLDRGRIKHIIVKLKS